MYLHLGNQIIALQKSVIGVFDMDTATWSYRTRETLEKLEQAGQVENAAGTELPKSFVLCSLGSGQTCYLSQLNTELMPDLEILPVSTINEACRVFGRNKSE